MGTEETPKVLQRRILTGFRVQVERARTQALKATTKNKECKKREKLLFAWLERQLACVTA